MRTASGLFRIGLLSLLINVWPLFLEGQTIDVSYYYRLTNLFLKETRPLTTYPGSSKTLFMGTSVTETGQKWKFTLLGNGVYKITNMNFGDDFCLDVRQNSQDPFIGNWGNYTGQYWKVVPAGNDYFHLIDAYGRRLDNDGGGDNRPRMVSGGNYSGQFWRLTRLEKIDIQNADSPVEFTMNNAYLMLEKNGDGSTDPAIFGKINFRLLKNGVPVNTWTLFNRTDQGGSRAIVRENERITLAPTTLKFSVKQSELSQYKLSLECDLWDYDASSSNDHLGSTSKQMPLTSFGRAATEMSVRLTGEGALKVAVSLFSGQQAKESLYDKLRTKTPTDVRYIDLDLETVHIAAADHVNGMAVNGEDIIVNFPHNNRQKGDIFWFSPGRGWKELTYDMFKSWETKEGNRFPSGMQASTRLLAVANNRYVDFFDLGGVGSSISQITSLSIQISSGNAEFIGFVYNPHLRRYYVVSTSKIWASEAGVEPFVNNQFNTAFKFSELIPASSSVFAIPAGEGGLALLYDETDPRNMICLSLGTDGAQSFRYKATRISVDSDGNFPKVSPPFVSRDIAPPPGHDLTGSGASFRWGGTARVREDGALVIYAAPKRLDNFFKPTSSDAIRWILW